MKAYYLLAAPVILAIWVVLLPIAFLTVAVLMLFPEKQRESFRMTGLDRH